MQASKTELHEYIAAHTSPESQLLHEVNRQTFLKVLQPHMISGHIQGRLLSMLSRMIMPKRILELGTFTGYSALCLAEGLVDNGELITIESNDELEELILNNFAKYSRPEALKLIIGEALEVLPKLKEKFDFVFIDADKTEYPSYLQLIIPLLNKNAFIVADNVLWYEKVLDLSAHADPSTKALAEFNAMINSDKRFQNIILPLRDGLMIAEYLP
ncbi:MAG TPA: O-methyltransferase [Salinivirgaceae bacterium]|nr:O-methyltransferase [Salinivirgaceae bacterium]HQA75569.1 O-methyltransferase [Salinivirgaceae bacterium]